MGATHDYIPPMENVKNEHQWHKDLFEYLIGYSYDLSFIFLAIIVIFLFKKYILKL